MNEWITSSSNYFGSRRRRGRPAKLALSLVVLVGSARNQGIAQNFNALEKPCTLPSGQAGLAVVTGRIYGALWGAHEDVLLVLRNADDEHNLAFGHTDEDGCYRFVAPPGPYLVRADVTGDQGFRMVELSATTPVTADFHINDRDTTMSVQVYDKLGRVYLSTVEYVTLPGGMPPDRVVGTLGDVRFPHRLRGRFVAGDGLGLLRVSGVAGQYRLTIRARGSRTKTVPVTIAGDGIREDNSVTLTPRKLGP